MAAATPQAQATVRPTLAGVAGRLLDLLYRPECVACGKPAACADGLPPATDDGLLRPLGKVLCRACLAACKPVSSPLCTVCGKPFSTAGGLDHVCAGCIRKPPAFDAARAAFCYTGPVRDLIHRFKYLGAAALAGPLAAALKIAWRRHLPTMAADVVVAVPMHPARRRQRGYNQAGLLVRRFKRLGLEGVGSVRLDDADTIVVRTRKTPAQAGLDRSRRLANLAGAFAVVRPRAVAGKAVLLVDDVITTGATAQQCCRVLKKAGATRVAVLTLARVVDE